MDKEPGSISLSVMQQAHINALVLQITEQGNALGARMKAGEKIPDTVLAQSAGQMQTAIVFMNIVNGVPNKVQTKEGFGGMPGVDLPNMN